MALLNLTHWCKMKGVSRDYACNMIREGRLDCIRYGKRCTLIDTAAVVRPSAFSVLKASKRGNQEQPE